MTINKKPETAYKDEFTFFSKDEQAFLETLHTLGENRTNSTVRIKSLAFKPMPTALDLELSKDFEESNEVYDNDETQHQAMLDSIHQGTRVLVEVNSIPLLIRDTAFASIYERLSIGGDALSVIPAKKLAQHLNDYAKYAKNDGLAIVNNGKLEAILGKNYKLIPAETVMQEAANYFATDKPASFISGSYTHSFCDAVWETGECKIDTPFSDDFKELRFKQTVAIGTSDNGRRSITVAPKLQQIGERYGLDFCQPLKLEHDGGATIDEFQKMMELIDKRFDDANKHIRKMTETVLQYPTNVLLSMLKWLKIPAKYGAEVYENKKLMWVNTEKTAYDVYVCLSDILSMLMTENETMRSLVQYQERYARALKFQFAAYDLPGAYGYNDKLIGNKGV